MEGWVGTKQLIVREPRLPRDEQKWEHRVCWSMSHKCISIRQGRGLHCTRLWVVWGPPVYLVSSLKQWTQKRWPHWAWTGFLSTWRHCWHLYLFSMGTDNTLRGIPGKDEEQSSEIRAILPHQSVVNSCEGIMNVNNQQGSLLTCHPLFQWLTNAFLHT